MPVKRFWLMTNSLERILADNEQRQARASRITQMNPEGVEKYFNNLRIQSGGSAITIVDEERDEAGINFLKQLSNKPAR
jgi:hypothetical protein